MVLKNLKGYTNIQVSEKLQPIIDLLNEEYAKKYGKLPQITSAYRSIEKQAQLYKQLAGKQAVAKPGHSLHNFGEAVDYADPKGIQAIIAANPRLQVLVNPGFRNDPWHFQLRNTPAIARDLSSAQSPQYSPQNTSPSVVPIQDELSALNEFLQDPVNNYKRRELI